jgi:hypothetical protein
VRALRGSRRAAGVVKEDHLSVSGDAVDERRVPGIEVSRGQSGWTCQRRPSLSGRYRSPPKSDRNRKNTLRASRKFDPARSAAYGFRVDEAFA